MDAKVLDVDLEDPLGRFKYRKCIYYSTYEKGLVAVNPYNERCTVEIQVPSNWSEFVRINGEVYIVDNGVWHVGRTSTMPLIAEHLLPVNNVSIKLKLKMQPKAIKIVPEGEGTLE